VNKIFAVCGVVSLQMRVCVDVPCTDLRNMKSLMVFLPKHAFLVNLHHHILHPHFI